jgi:hypothetical protein
MKEKVLGKKYRFWSIIEDNYNKIEEAIFSLENSKEDADYSHVGAWTCRRKYCSVQNAYFPSLPFPQGSEFGCLCATARVDGFKMVTSAVILQGHAIRMPAGIEPHPLSIRCALSIDVRVQKCNNLPGIAGGTCDYSIMDSNVMTVDESRTMIILKWIMRK